jgi:hypothetical protein
MNSGSKETSTLQDHNREDEKVLLPILLPILLIVGIACCVWPSFFVKRTGLRLRLLFAVIPERHHAAFIRGLGVIAVFASIVGLFQLVALWK